MLDFAAGLQLLGVAKQDKVALLAENSHRWLVADQGIMMCGAADVVRGSSAPAEELAFIVHHSGAVGAVVQDMAALDKLVAGAKAQDAGASSLAGLRFVVVLWGGPVAASSGSSGIAGPQQQQQQRQEAVPGLPVFSHEEVVVRGHAHREQQGFAPVAVSPDDLATLVYTSGTTGHPKGVMLSHANLMYQVASLSFFLDIRPGESVLSLLPPWHIYERTCSYFVLSRGLKQVYSSIRKLRDDLPLYQPDHFVCVPLVLDTLHARIMQRLRSATPLRAAVATALLGAGIAYVRARRVVDGVALQFALPGSQRSWAQLAAAALMSVLLRPLHMLASKLVYSKIREALGIRKTVISGGGSLATHLDDFYEAVGVTVLNGWGLSETSPVLACRRATAPLQNIRGSVGLPTPGTELRVVDPETLQDLEPPPSTSGSGSAAGAAQGRQGLVLARGPGVMRGYYRDEAATAKALRAGEGWFDTGDLGWIAPVNVPGSSMAGHLVLSGRAKDTIVLSSGKNVEPQPIEDAVQASPLIKFVVLLGQDKRELGALVWPDEDALAAGAVPAATAADTAQLHELLAAEVARLNASRADYHPFHHVAHIAVVRDPLSADAGTLTRTMKPRRPQIVKRYAKEVGHLMEQLRG